MTVSVFEPDQSGNPVATPVSVVDPNSAATTFTTAPQSQVWPPAGDPHAAWVFPTCAGISNFPSIAGSAASYSSAQSPALQASKIRAYAYGGGQLPAPTNSTDPLAAFGIMDSSEASFYGLGQADLENPSGNFVAPTTASVEAALKAAQPCTAVSATCPANTYQFDWSNPDPAAYPMPNITYAVVPAGGQSADTTTAIENLVTNMINFSTSATLPAGYYPMPTAMAQAALGDLHAAFSGPHASSTTGGSTSPLANAYTITSNNNVGTHSVPSSTFSPNSSTTAGSLTTTVGSTTTKAKGRTRVAARSLVIPPDLSRIFLSTASRFLLPSALVVELLCLVGGLLILLRARSNRRRQTTGDIA